MVWRSSVFEKFCCSTTGLNWATAAGAATARAAAAAKPQAHLHARSLILCLSQVEFAAPPAAGGSIAVRAQCRQMRTILGPGASSRVLHLVGPMRRLVVPGLIVAAAVGLLALLAFGVSHQGTNNSLDNALTRGQKP